MSKMQRIPWVLGLLVGCGGAGTTGGGEPTASSASAVQGGADDTTHRFAVGVARDPGGLDEATCSGALLAPNLVATARHCVASLSSTTLDCSVTFGAVTTERLVVTTDATISATGNNVKVSRVVVPASTALCGADIALLVLSSNIALPEYVVPVITPMTDHTRWGTSDTAIGYGADTTGVAGAGVRRIREHLGMVCIPNDPDFVDCCADTTAAGPMSFAEFGSGDGLCEGDSGSSAFDQKSFDEGTWASFGVLSRGGVSADGTTCAGSIYTRFDAWASLIVETAVQAATEGGYAPPSWTATPLPDGGPSVAAGICGATSTAGADGTTCDADGQCASGTCVSMDTVSFVCASPCGAGDACQAGFTCEGSPSYCFPGGSGVPSTHGGCAMAAGDPDVPWIVVTLGAGLGSLAARRRRGRRVRG